MRLYSVGRRPMHRTVGRFSPWTFVLVFRANSPRSVPLGGPGLSKSCAASVSHHSADTRRVWQSVRVQPEAIAGNWCAPRRIGRYRSSCSPFGGLSVQHDDPTNIATESAASDHADHAAARTFMPPAARSCSFVLSVTTSIYRTTVSRALRRSLRKKWILAG
jgi:hypothetical protein